LTRRTKKNIEHWQRVIKKKINDSEIFAGTDTQRGKTPGVGREKRGHHMERKKENGGVLIDDMNYRTIPVRMQASVDKHSFKPIISRFWAGKGLLTYIQRALVTMGDGGKGGKRKTTLYEKLIISHVS